MYKYVPVTAMVWIVYSSLNYKKTCIQYRESNGIDCTATQALAAVAITKEEEKKKSLWRKVSVNSFLIQFRLISNAVMKCILKPCREGEGIS